MNDLPCVKGDRSTRRELLASSVRYVALGGLTLLSAGLVMRRGNPICPRLPDCRDCAALDRCGLPEAVAARRSARRET
jgi:hypothetical protein